MGIEAIRKVEEAFGSMGSGTSLREAALHTVVHLTVSACLNLVGFCCICF